MPRNFSELKSGGTIPMLSPTLKSGGTRPTSPTDRRPCIGVTSIFSIEINFLNNFCDENVQRQAVRFVKSDYRRRSCVTTMIESLNCLKREQVRAVHRIQLCGCNNILTHSRCYTHHREHMQWHAVPCTHRFLQPSTRIA